MPSARAPPFWLAPCLLSEAENPKEGGRGLQKITTFLTFNDQAEEAVRFYVSVFKNSRILSTRCYSDA
jgi:hypothetical protein